LQTRRFEMRARVLVLFAAVAVALTLGVSSASADQLNLGNDTCGGGSWTVTAGPNVTGSGFSCTNDSSFSSGNGNIGGLSYSMTPIDGTSAAFHIFGGGNDLTGTIVWTYSTGLLPGGGGLDVLEGLLTVTSSSGFYNEYAVGGVYAIDLTLAGCSQSAGVVCTHPSSGEVPVPEPGTLSLLGMGLVTVAGRLRRKFRS
jgi:hypothetical protein